MRRTLPVIVSWMAGCVLLAVPVIASGGHGGGGGGHGGGGGGHGGGGGGGHAGGGGMRGGGSAGFRGGSSGGAFRGGGFRGGAGYRGGRGGFRGGYGYRGGYGLGYGYGGYGWGGYYGYPYLYGGFDDFGDSGYVDPYYNGYPSDGYGDGGYAYAPPPQPPVTIQQAPPAPAVREYLGPQNPPQSAQTQKYEEPLYLLAMNDGTIRAVLAYWADGPSLHYVTMEHEQKQAPLSSVDRALSERLNRERNVTFRLPG
jgi:hypothetical protein